MIPHLLILDKYTLKEFALIEPHECWLELSYYDVGSFEIYCTATNDNLNALKKGNFVMIPNKKFIWLITAVKYTFNANGTRMISATGKEAKWLLNKRIIPTPIQLPTNLSSAVYKLVNWNLGTGAAAARKINNFVVKELTTSDTIQNTQATRGNLLEFVSTLLKTYNYGSSVNFVSGSLQYEFWKGRDLTDTIIFSQSFDNLLSSEYSSNDDDLATYSLVVSTVEDVDYTQEYNQGQTGIDRAEILVNSNLSTKYEDEDGEEQETTPTSTLYKGWQVEEGKTELANHITLEEFNGEIDLLNSNYDFEMDFYIGDIVRVQDEYFDFYMNARITKITMSQDAKGYSEAIEYIKEDQNNG